MCESVCIYALIDPCTDEVRYIGKTVDLGHRFICHLSQPSRTPKWYWIRRLKRAGLVPRTRILEVVSPDDSWEEREKHWIAHGHEQGWPLTNLTDGGDGWTVGQKHSLESRRKMSCVQKGRTFTAEARAKLSASLSGKNHPNYGKKLGRSTRRKISEARKGVKLSPEHCAALRKAAKNRPPISEATREKLIETAPRGEDNTNSVLTAQQVVAIRERYANGDISQRQLAKAYSVCQRTINMVVNGITWTHITAEDVA